MKMVNSIIRIPRLCTEFQKALVKKRKESRPQKKEQIETYECFKAKIYEQGKSESQFMEGLLDYIDSKYTNSPVITNQAQCSNLEANQRQQAIKELSKFIAEVHTDLPAQ